MAKHKAILIFGAPGSGKGTLSRFLSGSPLLYHLSSGEFFRGLSIQSDAGKAFHAYADKGQLVPDDVTMSLLSVYINTLIASNRFNPREQWLLLDGIPRTPNQAKLIKEYVDIEAVLVLEVLSEKELFNRITKRASLEKRKDDADPTIFYKRIEIFKEETLAVLEGYPPSIIHKINAQQTPLCVARDALIILSTYIKDED